MIYGSRKDNEARVPLSLGKTEIIFKRGIDRVRHMMRQQKSQNISHLDSMAQTASTFFEEKQDP